MSNVIADSTGGVAIGVDMAHYAVLMEDPAYGVPTYGKPVSLPNTKSIVINANDSQNTAYYDNAPKISAVSKSEKAVGFTKSDFSNEEQRFLLGYQKTEDGITIEGSESMPPYVAFGFRALKSNGHYRYVWLTKGRFAIGKIKNETREENVNFQDQTINGTFISRNCDGLMKFQIDSDDPNCMKEIDKKWFTAETLAKLYKEVKEEAPASGE